MGFAYTDHRTLSWFTFLIGAFATSTGLIVYCIGQATEIVLDRIDQRARESLARLEDTTNQSMLP